MALPTLHTRALPAVNRLHGPHSKSLSMEINNRGAWRSTIDSSVCSSSTSRSAQKYVFVVVPPDEIAHERVTSPIILEFISKTSCRVGLRSWHHRYSFFCFYAPSRLQPTTRLSHPMVPTMDNAVNRIHAVSSNSSSTT